MTDFASLVRHLCEGGVDFIVIGGFAGTIHIFATLLTTHSPFAGGQKRSLTTAVSKTVGLAVRILFRTSGEIPSLLDLFDIGRSTT